jgi:hypothetical protein
VAVQAFVPRVGRQQSAVQTIMNLKVLARNGILVLVRELPDLLNQRWHVVAGPLENDQRIPLSCD